MKTNEADAPQGADELIAKDQEREAEAAAEKAEATTHDVEAIRSATEAEDVGDLASDEDRATLYRYLRRRSRMVNELTHFSDQVQAMMRKMKNDIDGLDYVYLGLAENITAKLLREQNAKKKNPSKSLKTPFGQVGFRTVGGGLAVIDEGKLILHLDQHWEDPKLASCLVRDPKLIKSELNKVFAESGELLPGCEISMVMNKFFVK